MLKFIQKDFVKNNLNKTFLTKTEVIPIFIGRERELASLKEFYEKDGIGMTVIYGRRRIGKSTLITEFAKDKKTIFIQPQKSEKIEIWNCFQSR